MFDSKEIANGHAQTAQLCIYTGRDDLVLSLTYEPRTTYQGETCSWSKIDTVTKFIVNVGSNIQLIDGEAFSAVSIGITTGEAVLP